MNIVIHRQIHGLKNNNRDTYATVNTTSFIASILPYQFIMSIHMQLECINKIKENTYLDDGVVPQLAR